MERQEPHVIPRVQLLVVCHFSQRFNHVGLVVLDCNNDSFDFQHILHSINSRKDRPGVFQRFPVICCYVGLALCGIDNQRVNPFIW